MQDILGDILLKQKQISKLHEKNFKWIQEAEGTNGVRFDQKALVPGTDYSLELLNSRLLGLLGLLSSLTETEDITLVPVVYLNNLNSTISEILNQEKTINDLINQVNKANGIGTLDASAYTIQSENGAVSLNLQANLATIYGQLEASLQHYYTLAVVINGDRYHDFSAAFDALAKNFKEINAKKQELDEILNSSKKQNEETANIKGLSEKDFEEISRLKGLVEKDKQTTAEYQSESTQAIVAIRVELAQAETLKASVQSYQAQFNDFQKQLDSRIETFATSKTQHDKIIAEGKKEQERLIAELINIEKEMNRLMAQSEGMLTGATVAGLASSFGSIRDKLSSELFWARWAFYGAIVFLFGSVLPLLVHVAPNLPQLFGIDLSLFKPLETGSAATEEQFIAGAIVRALLLLLGAWLVKFTAARHASLFRLKEHYTYKYSIASSVEGFKKQAEPFKDAIAAATFFELTFNPADKMETKGQTDRSPNKIMDWIMRKLGTTHDGESG